MRRYRNNLHFSTKDKANEAAETLRGRGMNGVTVTTMTDNILPPFQISFVNIETAIQAAGILKAAGVVDPDTLAFHLDANHCVTDGPNKGLHISEIENENLSITGLKIKIAVLREGHEDADLIRMTEHELFDREHQLAEQNATSKRRTVIGRLSFMKKRIANRQKTASETYRLRRFDIDVQISDLKSLLKRLDVDQAASPADWGYPGSLSHIEEQLEDILNGFKS